MRTLRALCVSALIAGGLAGCDFNGDCAGVGRPAVSVTVRDAATGVPTALGATLFVFRSGSPAVVDSVTGTSDDLPIMAAWDETGRFDLVVEKPGYFAWTATGVRVTGSCTVKTEYLAAALRPRPE